MFPLRDTIRAKSFPGITYSLIGINVLVFLLESLIGDHALTSMLSTYALIPARLSLTNPATWLPLITSTFLHGSWFHLLSNMWMLHIFGDNVEDRMGPGRYLVFYLLAGVVSGLVHALFSAYGNIPTLGASGAIAGVMGAYILFYPRGRVVTFIPGLFFLPWVIEVRAVLFLGIWFLSQLSNGLMSMGMVDVAQFSGVAWWAHVGGFVFGMIGSKICAGRKGSDLEPKIYSF